jgi:hypothetical protein
VVGQVEQQLVRLRRVRALVAVVVVHVAAGQAASAFL